MFLSIPSTSVQLPHSAADQIYRRVAANQPAFLKNWAGSLNNWAYAASLTRGDWSPYDTKWFCSEKAVVREEKGDKKKEKRWPWVSPWSWMYSLSLGEVSPPHNRLKFFSGDKIMVATCSLSLCTALYIHPWPLLSVITQCVAKLRHPRALRPLSFDRGSKNILTCSLCLPPLPSHSLFPCSHWLVTFCHSIHPPPPLLPHPSLLHAQKTRLRSQKIPPVY